MKSGTLEKHHCPPMLVGGGGGLFGGGCSFFDKRLGVFIDWGFAFLFWSLMEFYGNGGTS